MYIRQFAFASAFALLLLSLDAAASDNMTHSLPRGCESTGYVFNNNLLVLNQAGKQRLFLIQNSGDRTITIKHKTLKPVFMGVGYNSSINIKKWSALATDEKDMHFICIDKVSNHNIPCETILSVCQYPHVKFALSNRGIYWVSKNKTLYQSKRLARTKGIYLR